MDQPKPKLPELLAPAGNPERLRTALHYGADAVYVGLKAMSLRNYADNFSPAELKEACALAHGMGRRVYVTLNAFARDEELQALPQLLGQAVSLYRSMGREKLRLLCAPGNGPAQTFYAGCGFVRVGSRPGSHGQLDLLEKDIRV